MKRVLLFMLMSQLINLTTSAQNWRTTDLELNATEGISVVDDNVIWIRDRGNLDAGFAITTDGGATWTYKDFPPELSESTIFIGVMSAVSATTAYVILSQDNSLSVRGLYKTTDAGDTWTRQDLIFNGSSSFPNQVHFWNENEGFVMGDGPSWFGPEIYAYSYGQWYIPAPIETSGFYSFNTHNYLRIVGSSAYILLNNGNILKSLDQGSIRGVYWSEIVTPFSGIQDVVNISYDFKDDLNGIVVYNNNVTNSAYSTTDGGVTWNSLGSDITNLYSYIKFIPAQNKYYSRNNSSPEFGLSYSEDGITWIRDENFNNKLLGEIEFTPTGTAFMAGRDVVYTLAPDYSTHPDYPALEALFNATNGDNWSNNTNWLDVTKPFDTWHGILTSNVNGANRIRHINLELNNLEGEIPNEINSLSALNTINLSDNYLSGEFPLDTSNFSTLDAVFINQNHFTFSDLEPQFNNLSNTLQAFSYSPMKPFDESTNATIAPRISFELTTKFSSLASVSNNNVYQWYKDGSAIADSNTPSYIVESARNNDSGTYFCEVSNPNIPDLILQRRPYNLIVSGSASSDFEFSIIPNPGRDIIRISSEEYIDGALITIYNNQGNEVLQTNIFEVSNYQIDISSLRQGLFILTLATDAGVYTKRLVKRR